MRKVLVILNFIFLVGCQNFHEVDPGKLYRSAQLNKAELAKVIDEYGIKTVINLRGERNQEGWFRDELAVTSAKNVELVNIGMGADRLPHKDDLVQLLDVLHTAQRPILVHCYQGADRTGEASALYEIEYMGKSKTEALKMLTPRYFHLPWATPSKTYFINMYQGEKWAKETYDPCASDMKYYSKEYFCRQRYGLKTEVGLFVQLKKKLAKIWPRPKSRASARF